MPSVPVRAESGDATPDRLELGFAATPEAQEHRGGLVAVRDLATDLRPLRRAEDAIGHTRPPFDRAHRLRVDPDFAHPAQCDEHQVVAVRDAEPDPRRLQSARERRLSVQADLDRHRTGRDREQRREHLAKAEPGHGEPACDVLVLVPLEALSLRRVEQRERLRQRIGVRHERRAAHHHLAAGNECGERVVRPDGEGDAQRWVVHPATPVGRKPAAARARCA